MWKIGVYRVLIINIENFLYINYNTISYFFLK